MFQDCPKSDSKVYLVSFVGCGGRPVSSRIFSCISICSLCYLLSPEARVGSTHLNKSTIKDSDNQIKVNKSWIPLSKFYEGGIVPQAPSKVEMPTNEDRCRNTN
jgi:hypothetical protein